MKAYEAKSYGRNSEVKTIYGLFDAGKDISMHGPRRLGKTFVLDRTVEQASKYGYICIKVEIAGCVDTKGVSRLICDAIGAQRPLTKRAASALKQRALQMISPRGESAGPWYQSATNVDWGQYLDTLLSDFQKNTMENWAILIDELPIFLKALHDKGPEGIAQARDFMNLFSRLRSANSRVRWLITGSIGIGPLAQIGQYLGTLAKFHNFELEPLSEQQAISYVRDLPKYGLPQGRTKVTLPEAIAIIDAVGWRAPFYLEALVHQLPSTHSENPESVKQGIAHAIEGLLRPFNRSTFETWVEHLRKHYSDPKLTLGFEILAAIARHEDGLTLDGVLAQLSQSILRRDELLQCLQQLSDDGYLYQKHFGQDDSPYRFRLLPLRLWWLRHRPQA